MKYLNKFRSDDELQKNYYGYGSLVTSFVANNTTYNYSHFENGEYYIWEDPNYPNDETHSVTTYGVRNPEVGYMVTSWSGSDYEITSVTTQQFTGRDIPYNQPWASWIPGVGVNYNKYHCKFNGQEYVDLGLSSQTLWATCNIGASTSEATGGYYAWGELTTKASYSWDNYRFGTDDEILKYNLNDGKLHLELEDDVANVTMGGDWHIPTYSQFIELGQHTTVTEETINGVSGTKFTSVEDTTKAIFIPYCGYIESGGLVDTSVPYYWTNERPDGLSDSGIESKGDNMWKYKGLQVRACIDASALKSPITDGSSPIPIEQPAT